MLRLTGIRRVIYKSFNNEIKEVKGNVTINNDIVSIVLDSDNKSEIIIFKERVIEIVRCANE
jgi:hypothetical protein